MTDGDEGVNRDLQAYATSGDAMEVHSRLGHESLEAVYQEALAIEFTEPSMLHLREVEIPAFGASNAEQHHLVREHTDLRSL